MIEFGTDGWRAVIAEDFTFENVKILSQAIADYLKLTVKGKKSIVIGYDCRFLSLEFARAVSSVLAANNIKVVLSDRAVPTPIVSFHCCYNGFDLGIMIMPSAPSQPPPNATIVLSHLGEGQLPPKFHALGIWGRLGGGRYWHKLYFR